MALSKKPVKLQPFVAEDIVETLIHKGSGTTVIEVEKTAKKGLKKGLKNGQVPVQLRLSPQILDVIDGLIAQKLIPCSRHSWFMNAISEQIKREQVQL